MTDVGVNTQDKVRTANKLLKSKKDIAKRLLQSEINNAKQLLKIAKAEEKREIAEAKKLLWEEKASKKLVWKLCITANHLEVTEALYA